MAVRIGYVFAGLAVSDRDRAVEWYERLLGRPPDMLPNEREAAWQLVDTASVYLVEDPERAGRGVVTLIVDDLSAALDEMTARGVVTGAVEEVGTAGWKAVSVDPDGNMVAMVELVGAGDGQSR